MLARFVQDEGNSGHFLRHGAGGKICLPGLRIDGELVGAELQTSCR